MRLPWVICGLLFFSVAVNYIDLRAFQEQIIIAQRNLKAQQHSAELTKQRFQGGFVSGLDVANAEAQVATTSGQIPLLEALLDFFGHYSHGMERFHDPGVLLLAGSFLLAQDAAGVA